VFAPLLLQEKEKAAPDLFFRGSLGMFDGHIGCFEFQCPLKGLFLAEDPGRQQHEFFSGSFPDPFQAGKFDLDFLDWVRGEKTELSAEVKNEVEIHGPLILALPWKHFQKRVNLWISRVS
jgi:hypothetical protein